MEGKSSFRVDTKGVCFLCLEEVVDHSERSYSYRTLSRYLRLDHAKIYNWKMDGNDSSLYGDALKKTEFMVSLCPECFQLTTSFSDLVQDLEVIKIKLFRSVQKIHDVILESNQEGSRMERCKQRMVTPNPVDILQIGIVENLRKETVNQCELELKKGINLPQVILSRKEVDNFTPSVGKRKKTFRRVITSDSSESEEEKQDGLTDPPHSRSSSPDILGCEDEHVDAKCIPRRRPSSSESNSGSTTSTNFMPKNGVRRRKIKYKRTKDVSKETETSERTSDPSSNVMGDDSFIEDVLNVRPKQKPTKTPPPSVSVTFNCQFCVRRFSDFATRSLHTIDDHSHLLFSFVKTRNVSDKLFKAVVQHALETLMKDEHLDELENENRWKCQFCDWSTRQTNKSEFLTIHRHLVDKHFAKICVELTRIQKDQDLLKILKSKFNGVFVCEACNASFKLKYHLRRHQLKQCAVLAKKEPNDNKVEVEGSVHLVNDEVASHSRTVDIDSSGESSTSSETESDSDSQEKVQVTKKTKPSRLMKAPKLMTTPKSASSSNVIIVNVKRKRSKFKCNGCGITFTREGNFERHKKFTCPVLMTKSENSSSSVVESNENEVEMDEDEPMIDKEELLKLQNEGNNLLQLPEEFEVKPDVSLLLMEAEEEEDAPLVDENEEPCWRSVLVPNDLMDPNPLDECKPIVDVENGGVLRVEVEDGMIDQQENVETVGITKSGNVVGSEPPPEVLHEIQDSDIIVDDVRIDVSQNMMIIDTTTAEATASCFRDFSGKPVIKRCADEDEAILPNSPMEDNES